VKKILQYAVLPRTGKDASMASIFHTASVLNKTCTVSVK